ncbi:MAG: helix-turn-helix transcriptional regulator [Mycobacteriales bacterium]
MLADVAMRVSSPVLVGRVGELRRLHEHLAAASAGQPRVVVIAGEAGIGKTRLVAEFQPSAVEAGARVLAGGCVELSAEGLPFAPFTAILRELVRTEGAAGVQRLCPDPSPLGGLSPEFGHPGGDDTGLARTRLFEAFLLLLERLAEDRTLVLVIEDLHWADRSTRDMLAFIARNVRAGRLLVLATYRSDDLHRRHPLRRFVAELERLPSVEHLALARLARPDVAAQFEGIAGTVATKPIIDELMRRTEGNPLFVEALVSDAGVSGELDGTLRDLLLRALQRVSEPAQQVARIASAAGQRTSYRLLAACWPGAPAELDVALREAVEHNVLVADADTVSFRHALIREAVCDEFLPGEQVAMHRALAEAIEADPTVVPQGRASIEVAYHWDHAHVLDLALRAAWAASADAAASFAYAEQLDLIERVLALWAQVPDAAERIGEDEARVLSDASEAALNAGDAHRALAYASRALAELDGERDPGRVAAVLVRRAWIRVQLRQNDIPDLLEAARLADRAGEAEGIALAYARLSCAQSLANIYPEARAHGVRALDVARTVDSPRAMAVALNSMGIVHGQDGEYALAITCAREAQEQARRAGLLEEALRATVNLIDAHTCLGRYDEAIEIGRSAVARARAAGLERTTGAFLNLNVVEPLVALGRWTEALDLIDEVLHLGPPPRHQSMLLRNRAFMILHRGDPDGAEAGLERALRSRPEVDPQPQHQLSLDQITAELALERGDRGHALEVVLISLDSSFRPGMARYAWPLTALGTRLAVQEQERARVLRDPGAAAGAERALKTLLAHAEALPADIPVLAAWSLLNDAEIAGTAAAWAAAGRAWQGVGDPYQMAYSWLRAAEAAAAEGASADAVELLHRADGLALQLGAQPLHSAAADLAHRARLRPRELPDPTPVAVPAAGAGSPSDDPGAHLGDSSTSAAGVRSAAAVGAAAGVAIGLTNRESDVLQLLGAGLSNREIGERLFISPKTASVHVSNLMAKLGAPSRTAAAAAAHRLGLLN